jgi:hypothetical protein
MMDGDPDGHYAALGLSPGATASDVSAAFRRAAKLLHPDVPVTGDAAAFMRVRSAYGVLGSPLRRAEYDRRATEAGAEEAEAGFDPWKPDDDPWKDDHHADVDDDWFAEDRPMDSAAWSRAAAASPSPLARDDFAYPSRGWPWRVGVIVAGLLAAGGLSVAVVQRGAAPVRVAVSVPATAPPVPAGPPVPDASVAPPPIDPGLAPDHYVLPAGEPATLWRDDGAGQFAIAGRLSAFTSVEARRLVPSRGFVEVRAPGGQSGYVAAGRLAPGNPAEAHRAFCIENAGAPMSSGEILRTPPSVAPGTGGRLEVQNDGDTGAVLKLRDAHGAVGVAVFVGPGDHATIHDVPGGIYRAQVAIGDLWSRRCGRFMAGMRTEMHARPDAIGAAAGGPPGLLYRLPLPDGGDWHDIPDAAFATD